MITISTPNGKNYSEENLIEKAEKHLAEHRNKGQYGGPYNLILFWERCFLAAIRECKNLRKRNKELEDIKEILESCGAKGR